MPFITIFTPTYNRKKTLERLYKSLTKQTFKDFEWLIVDDGSTDDTKEYIQSLINSLTDFKIRYYYQKNSGKHVAYNLGLSLAKGVYFFCVDSDDWLPIDSIENINKKMVNKKEINIIGVIGLKSLKNGKLLSPLFPSNLLYSNTFYLTDTLHYRGEWSLVFETKKANDFPFPSIEGEKFMGESVIYDEISKFYNQYLDNHIYAICEYQEDGLSRNIYHLMKNNPGGYLLYYRNRIDMTTSIKLRIKYIILYWIFYNYYGKKNISYKGKYLFITSIIRPMGYWAYLFHKYFK